MKAKIVSGPGFTIVRDGCLPWLRQPVDHVITDPPYEADMHNAKQGGRGIRNDGQPDLKPVGFASIGRLRKRVARDCILHAGGWFIAFCTPEGVAPWRDAIEEAGGRYKRACVWVKPDAAPQFNGQGPAYGAEMFVTAWCGSGVSRWNGGGGRNVFTHNTNSAGRHGEHPTEKPLSLLTEIIEKFTNPGEVIFDPFMGSGTTGVAALRLGRRFFGVERDARFFQIAQERVSAAAAQKDLFVQPAPKAIQLSVAKEWPRQKREKKHGTGTSPQH